MLESSNGCESTDSRPIYAAEVSEDYATSQPNHLGQRRDIPFTLAGDDCPSLADNSTQEGIGFQLRAFSREISALQTNLWTEATALKQNINVASLSNELVNETLNYFVNCRQRLTQMTQAYDDTDAYVLLLQEKEVDLELAARIGQELLKQNKQLKSSIKNLEEELTKRQDDVQQLKHELASKVSLLDTFIEEEEHQTSIAHGRDEESGIRQDPSSSRPGTSTHDPSIKSTISSPPVIDNHDEDCRNGFLSLNLNHHKPTSTLVEPFSSLPYQLYGYSSTDPRQQQQQTQADDLASLTDEEAVPATKSREQDKLTQTVTFQLVESNKRLCELQDELMYKGEQNLLQQEKIYHLQEQLRESDRRLDDVATENESLQKSIQESSEIQRELSEELKICKRNFNELLDVFLELQKESRIYRNKTMQQNSSANYFGELDPAHDINNISFDSFNNDMADTHPQSSSCDPYGPTSRMSAGVARSISSNTMPISSSLLDELQESIRGSRNGRHEDGLEEDEDDRGGHSTDSSGETSDGADSGVHTAVTVTTGNSSPSSRLNSSSAQADMANQDSTSDPNHAGGPTDNGSDSESKGDTQSNSNMHWVGFSSFMLTTLLLLCLSVTFNSPANLGSVPKLQIKLDR